MSIKKRLDKLEQRQAPNKYTIGTQIGDGPVEVEGEEMTEEEFAERYPNCILVNYADNAPPPDNADLLDSW